MIKNKSHIVYGLFEVSTKNRTENFCNNVLCALMQFSVQFWLNCDLDQINKYHIRFLNNLLMMMMIIIMSIFASKHLPVFA